MVIRLISISHAIRVLFNHPKLGMRGDGCASSVGGRAIGAAHVRIAIPSLGLGPDREIRAEGLRAPDLWNV